MATIVSPFTLRNVRKMPVNQSTAISNPTASKGRPSDVARNIATTGNPPGTVIVPMFNKMASVMLRTISPAESSTSPAWARNMTTIT